jgi:hypothetical protein
MCGRFNLFEPDPYPRRGIRCLRLSSATSALQSHPIPTRVGVHANPFGNGGEITLLRWT